jgi:hypothetical protein
VIVFVSFAGLAATTFWFGRDLPRRWVERRLASMLDAEVRLERLEIDNLHHFVLRGVDVEKVSWESRLERLSIERVDVEAPVREALNGRYQKLSIDGVGVRLVPSTRQARPLPRSNLQAREIEIRRGWMVATAGEHATRLEFAAIVSNWGIEPTGHVSLTAEQIDARPLLEILGGTHREPGGQLPDGVAAIHATAERLRVDAFLQVGLEPLRVDATAGRLRLLYGERGVELRLPRLSAAVERDDPDDALRLEILPSVPGIEAVALEAVLDVETYALRSGRAEFRGIEIATLLEAGGPLPAGWTVDGAANLIVGTDDGQSFAYELDTRSAHLELPLGSATFSSEEIEATVRGTWDSATEDRGPNPLGYELDARLGTLRIASGATEFIATGSRIASRGELDATGSGELRASLTLPGGSGRHEKLTLPRDLFPIDASLDGSVAFGEAPSFDGTSLLLSPILGRLQIRGRTIIEGNRPFAHWLWDWSGAPELPALRRTGSQLGLGVLPSEVESAGRPSAHGSLQGALTDPLLRGQLLIEQLELSPTTGVATDAVGNWKVDGARATVDFSRRAGDGGRFRFDLVNIDGRLDPGSDRTPDASWISPLAVTATGWTDLQRGEMELDSARIDLRRLGSMQVAGRLEADRSISLTARIEPVELSEIRELSHLWLEDLAPDYTLQGTARSRHDVRRTAEGEWHTTGEIDLNGVGFGSRDGARVVEGAEAHWNVALSSPRGGSIEGEATATLTGPVVLWGTLFGDYSQLISEVRIHARRDGGRWESTADWDLPHGVAVGARLSAAPGPGLAPVNYAVSVDFPDLGEFLGHYVRGPFEGSVERLDTLGAAGRLHIDLAGVVDEARHDIEGTVAAAGASFTGAEGATGVEGLNLDLPISLRWNRNADGPDSLVPGPEHTGSFAYQRLRLGGLEFPPLDTRLIVASDTVRLDRPLNLSLLDGQVELRQVALAEWSRPARDLRFGLRLDELSLAALTHALGAFPLQGTLSGTFPAVHLTPDRLLVDGGGTIEVFGGAVEVFDISARDFLGRFPRLQFSAHLDGVHLLDVTRTFDFGEVYGVVNGEIRDCELFGGAPVRCEGTLGSVKTKGVPQKISVKAIRNISILGAGSHVGMFDRGLQKFFDTYTYSRLGFTMKLDRDRFLLRGTERRGQSELFVKGRLPFRIDIVNAAPGQTVSFQTMMSRLRNIQVEAPGRNVRKTTPSK